MLNFNYIYRISTSGEGTSADFAAFHPWPRQALKHRVRAQGPASNRVAFSKPPAQIGHASAGPDQLCIVVGPAPKRDRHGARLGSAGGGKKIDDTPRDATTEV